MRSRAGLRAWSWLVRRPAFYRRAVRFGAKILRRRARGQGRLRQIPLAAGWTGGRDLPAPEGDTFIQQWHKGARGDASGERLRRRGR